MWKSPNGTIRALLDGTVFRAPILVDGIHPFVRTWKAPITVARHAYGDVYKNSELRVDGPATASLKVDYTDGRTARNKTIFTSSPNLASSRACTTAMHPSPASPTPCFTYALDTKQDLWFATKDTISKIYDHRFKDIFQEIFDARLQGTF